MHLLSFAVSALVANAAGVTAVNFYCPYTPLTNLATAALCCTGVDLVVGQDFTGTATGCTLEQGVSETDVNTGGCARGTQFICCGAEVGAGAWELCGPPSQGTD